MMAQGSMITEQNKTPGFALQISLSRYLVAPSFYGECSCTTFVIFCTFILTSNAFFRISVASLAMTINNRRRSAVNTTFTENVFLSRRSTASYCAANTPTQ